MGPLAGPCRPRVHRCLRRRWLWEHRPAKPFVARPREPSQACDPVRASLLSGGGASTPVSIAPVLGAQQHSGAAVQGTVCLPVAREALLLSSWLCASHVRLHACSLHPFIPCWLPTRAGPQHGREHPRLVHAAAPRQAVTALRRATRLCALPPASASHASAPSFLASPGAPWLYTMFHTCALPVF